MDIKLNVLHLISSLEKKGPVQVIFDLIKNSDHNKFNFIVVALKPCKNNILKREFEKLPIKLIELENIMPYNFLVFNKIVSDITNQENVSICHSHCTRSLMINVITCKKLIRFHSIQIYPGLQSKTMNGFFAGSLINMFTKMTLKLIEYPISCSKYVHDSLLLNDKIKTNIVVNGSKSNYTQDLSKSELKIKLGFDCNYKYFISVGRLSPEKNFKYLINNFLNSNHEGYKLVIVGDGDLEKELKSISKSDDILILGFKSNFEEYIYASDYYISTSLTEGMPLSVLIGMEAGLPILLSNIPAHKEIFDIALNEEKNIGKLFDINLNKINLINFIDKLDVEKISKDVKSVYLNNFTPINMAKSYNNLYTNSIKNRNYV
jgi:glycosyltransferase involved in cell wall biosynthesis